MGLVHHPNVVSDGLIGCWDAANRRSYPGAGTTWTDIAGSYNSALENWAGSSFSSEKLGCLDFDGTDAYAQLSMPATTFSGNGTLSIWMKWNGDIQDGIFAVKGASLLGNYYDGEYWGFQKSNTNASQIRFHTGQGWATTITHGLSDGDWANIVVVYNGSGGSGTCYINGVNKGSLGWTAYSTTDGDAHVGHGGYSNAYYDGEIASVQIYNRQLTAAEVFQNYEALKPRFVPRITTDGLFASWDAGDPNSYSGGTTLKDTANNYDGTFVNNGSGGDISFDSANGGSLVFDGSDDYVNITTLPDYSGTARSAIIWFNVDDMDGGIYTPFQSATDQFCVSFGQYETGGTVYAAFRSENSGSNYTYGVSTTVSDGVWTCWAVTINASDEIVAVYQNGDSKSLTAGHGFTIKTGTTIGCRLNSSTIENDFDGKVGSVRLYTKTLSAAEILDNYNATKGRFT